MEMMMSNSISDPYLTALISQRPDLEKPFYDFLLEKKLSGSVSFNSYIGFINTPTWALTALYERKPDDSIVSHPNFDSKILKSIISQANSPVIAGAVHSPNITNEQLAEVAKVSNESLAAWANYYITRNSKKLEELILEQLNVDPNDRSFTLNHALLEENFSDSLFNILAKRCEEKVHSTYNQKFGDMLVRNPHLSPEQRAMLHLLGFNKEDSDTDYSKYPSTIYIIQMSEVNDGFNDEITKIFFELGHPLALVHSQASTPKVVSMEVDLSQIIDSEYLHRMFWKELDEKVDGFSLNFHNGYRVQDLFVNHPTISHEFDMADFEEGWKVGGVLQGYIDREWITKEESLDPEGMENLMTSYADNLEEITADLETFEEAQPFILAFLRYPTEGQDLCLENGIELTDIAIEQIESAAIERADSEDWDIDVSINSDFNEFLSWENLPIQQKNQIFESLSFGFGCESQKLRKSSEHFLACIALHPASPAPMINALQKLDCEVIQSTLKLR
jgi:hypothetical protein